MDPHRSWQPTPACVMSTGAPLAATATAALATARAGKSIALSTKLANYAQADEKLHSLSRKAVAIGRNYVDHAREMGAPIPSEPFWFFKPSTSYLRAPGASATRSTTAVVHLPHGADVHHEVELAAVIGCRATRVRATNAMCHVAGYVCAVDLTARNWQAVAKKNGQPWSRAKGCDTFLPVSEFVPVRTLPLPDPTMRARIWLRVNGQLRQDGNTDQMIFHLPDLVENVTRHVTLEEWDLLLTGTPAGVGPLVHGDVVTAGIDDLVTLQFRCEQASE